MFKGETRLFIYQVRGVMRALEPGTAATLPVDRTPPRVACGAADDKWHGDNIRINCTAEDREFGLGSQADARFAVSTAVADGDKTSAAETESRTVCDVGGNCAASPPSAATGSIANHQPSTSRRREPEPSTCSISALPGRSPVPTVDRASRRATAPRPTAVLSRQSVGGAAFSVTAADQVGNSQTVSVPYAVTYAIETVNDADLAAREGESVHLALRIADAVGANRSDSSIAIRAKGIVSPDGAVRALAEVARFDEGLGAYRIDVKIDAAGAYRLQLEVDGDPVVHAVPFRVR